MATFDTIKSKLTGLLNSANETTGEQDATLTDAVTRLRAGYGTSAVTEPLSVKENGTYTPGEGVDGFSPVTVKVPNTYADADEGKVVVSKALKEQTSVTVTETGTYTTTTNNEVIVNIPDAKGVKF